VHRRRRKGSSTAVTLTDISWSEDDDVEETEESIPLAYKRL